MRKYSIMYYFNVDFNKFNFFKKRDFFTQARGSESSEREMGGGGGGGAPG